jgi:hypothetical protein
MTALWSTDWGQAMRGGDRVYHFALFGDGWHIVVGLSTLAIVPSTSRQDALAAIDALDAKIKNGGVDGST